MEGTGSYGAGLARHLTEAGIGVVEVNRPNRQLRRRRGKDDTTDAEAAARAALNGEATARPKTGYGPVEATRMLRVVRRSAVKARTQAANQLHALVVTAPEPLKDQLKGITPKARVKVCARFRPGTDHTTTHAKRALRYLARRYQTLTAEITGLCVQANPALLAAPGVGPDTAATLLTAAGDNPQRMNTNTAFAALCGASPIAASSGRTVRHRLNRGGNRQANNALWPMRYQPNTSRPPHQTIRCPTSGRNKEPAGDHPLPETSHRPRQSTGRSPTRPQHRTDPTYATTEPKPESLSPTPPTASTHNPPSYPDSSEASTTTTNSPPDTSSGPILDNRFARNRSIDEPPNRTRDAHLDRIRENPLRQQQNRHTTDPSELAPRHGGPSKPPENSA